MKIVAALRRECLVGSIFALLMLLPLVTNAQCAFPGGFATSYCVDNSPVVLTGGTNYYGPGVSGGIFTPSVAGIGTHRIFTTDGTASSYTVSSSGTFGPYLLSSPTQIFPANNSYADIPVGFAFKFYGNDYTSARVFDNAFLRLTNDTDGNPSAQLLPDASNPNNVIAAAWSDLDPTTGIIQYQTIGTAPLRVLVVEYINVRFVSTPSQFVTTQLQLYETSNIIEIHSTQIGTDATDLKTMGIENSDGSVATTVIGRNKSSWTASNDFVSFIPSCTDRKFVKVNGLPDNSLAVSPASTTICQNASVGVTVANSQIGVSYQLRNDATNAVLGGAVLGNGSSIILNSAAIPATLDIKVRATNLTTLCVADLLNKVTVTVNAIPSTAVAGAPQNICGLAALLTGNTPTSGTGQWSKISGPGTVTFTSTDASTPTATATVSAYGSYVLRWSITNGVCLPSTSDVSLNFYDTPTTPLAGSDISQCNNGTFTMAANTPLVGTGAWSVISGVATPLTPNSPTSVIAGVPTGSTAVLRWTISNQSCGSLTDDVSLFNNSAPAPFIFGPVSVCAGQAGVAYNVPPTSNNFSWTVIGGSITSANGSSTVVVTWDAVGPASIQVTETNPVTTCSTTTLPTPITINPVPVPAFTGPPAVCAGQSGVVYFTTPMTGHVYNWSVTGGAITAGGSSAAVTVIWGSAGSGTVQLTETISATGCATILSSPVTINPAPNPTIAGPNSVCSGQSGVSYSSAASGNDLVWTIVGGSITSGDGTNNIVVDWNATGPASLQLTETNPATGCYTVGNIFPVSINPVPTPVISGLSSVCANQAGVTYSTPVATGRSYLWSVSGGTISSGSGTRTITVAWGSSAGGIVQLTETISATGCSTTALDYAVTIHALPTPAVVGPNSVCPNQAGVSYSTAGSGNSYLWTIVGGTITSGNGSNTVLVTWDPTGPASLRVTETSAVSPFCAAPSAIYNVTINPAPTPTISGPSSSCAARTGVIYNVSPASGRSYAWTITGGTITAGSTTNSITVTWGGVGTGKIKVTETIVATGCAVTTPDYLVTINPNPTPVISGPSSSCANTNNLVYSTAFNGTSTYLWVVSAGGTIVGSATNNTVTINWGAAGARTVRVTETNSITGCFLQTGNFNVTVANPTPVISGPINVCSNQAGVTYSTPVASGRTYNWVVTNGVVASGGTTASITINWDATGPGQIQLTETITATGCFVTTPVYTVTINPVPSPAISGLANVCANQANVIYTTPFVAGNSYAWSVAGGGIFSGAGSNSISVTFGPTGSGVVSLTQSILATGCSTSTTFNVAIQSPTPVVTGPISVCPNQSNVNYSTPNNVGNQYTWIVVGGTVASGAGTNAINVNWGGTGTGAVFLTERIPSSGCATSISPYFVTIVSGPVAQAGSDLETCQEVLIDFATQSTLAQATNYSAINWTTTGTGTLTGANTLTPKYLPSPGETGAKVFTLSATSLSGCADVTDDMILIITPLPVVNAGSDLEVCQGSVIDFATQSSPANAFNNGSIQWTTNGAGSLFSSGSLAPTYLSSSTETGQKTFTLTVTGNGSCPGATDNINLFITDKPTAVAGSDENVCQNATFNFSSQTTPSAASSFSSISWTTTGGGLLTNANTLIPSYTPATGELGPVSFTLTAVGNGSCTNANGIMILSVSPPPTVDAGSNGQVCQGNTFSFSSQTVPATATAFSSLSWTHNGLGSLVNTNTFTPLYTPASGETGNITFTLTASGAGTCAAVQDVMQLLILPAPTGFAGGDAETCAGAAISFGSRPIPANASNYSALQWTTNGAGLLTGANTISPTYMPATGETGSLTFSLKITGLNGVCSFIQDDMMLAVTPLVVINAGSDQQICQQSFFNFASQSLPASAQNYSSLQWTHSGTGLLFNTNTLTPTYFLGAAETGDVVFTLTANSTGTCSSLSDQMTLNIVLAPQANAGADAKICENVSTFDFASRSLIASFANGTMQWSHDGTGNLSNIGVLNPVYTVGSGDAANVVTFTLTVTDLNSVCSPAVDQFALKVNTLPTVVFSGLPSVISEKNPPITLTGNQSGGIFTIAPLSSNIGSTVHTPVDNVSFNPGFATLGANDVTYTFTNANGCTNSDTKAVNVNPVTIIDFVLQYQNGTPPYPFVATDGSGGFEVCADVGLVKIVGNPAPGTGILPTNITAVGPNASNISILTSLGEYYIDTNGLASDTYNIQYFYTNSLGTPSPPLIKQVKVFASPKPVISVFNNCVVSAIQFNGSYTLPPTTFPPASVTWLWNLGAGEGLSVDQNPAHIYAGSGVKNVSLSVTSSQGCTGAQLQSVSVGDVPIVDFGWSSICTSDTTKYKDNTNPGSVSQITQYRWDFGDGDVLIGPFSGTVPPNTHGGRTGGTFKNPKHKYVSSGSFLTSLTVDTNTGCNNANGKQVFILPAGTTARPDPGAPYYMDFEASNGGWIPEGLSVAASLPSPISWKWGPPTGASIKRASSGGNVWWTGNNTDSYFPSEQSVLNGPCFDLSLLSRPMVSLDYWSDDENNLDGAALQYSTDGGLVWRIVGPSEGQADRDEGINWFNGLGIPSNPGLQSIGNYGWTGKTEMWKTARFNLNMIPKSERKQVRLRVGFGSNSVNAPGQTFDGFALDNFLVGDKKRNVLVENFTNSNDSKSILANAYIDNLFQGQYVFTSAPDFHYIEYHTSTPKEDPENIANPTDPAARMLYYGVSHPPTTIMDGMVDGKKFKGFYTDLNQVEIDRRALSSPPFGLVLRELPTATKDVISVRLAIGANTDMNVPLIAQVVLVESVVGTSKNVLRKQLFGADGETLAIKFNKGDTLFKTSTDVKLDVPILHSDGLTLLAYIQNKDTKEIYQSVIIPSSIKQTKVVTGVNGIEETGRFSVYPNPARDHFFIINPRAHTAGNLLWSLADQRGVIVAKGEFNGPSARIDVPELANGLYLVKVGTSEGAFQFMKVVIAK